MKTNINAWPDSCYLLIPSFMSENSLIKMLPKLLCIIPSTHIYVVDDGSTDDTSLICRKTGIQYIRHKKNRGKGSALKSGFKEILGKNAEWILTIDADGQHALDDIPAFLEKVSAEPENGIIIGKRNKKIGYMPFERILSNRITSFVCTLLTGKRISDCQCGFRIYSTGLLKKITLKYDHFELETEVILKACKLGYRISFIPVQTLYLSRKSNISHIKDTLRWTWSVIDIKLNQIINRM